MRTFFIVVISMLIILQIADGCLTHYAVSNGLAEEANPLCLWLIGIVGLANAIFAVKSVAIAIFTAMLIYPPRLNRSRLSLFSSIAAFYIFVVTKNMMLI